MLAKKERVKKCNYKQIKSFYEMRYKQPCTQYKVDMFSANTRGGKAFAAEQKIRI